MTFFSHLTFLPMAARGPFSNRAWGQLPRVQGKRLERRYTSAVFPNRHLRLFLLQNRHQQGFARLFVTTCNCSPLGTPDVIANRSRGGAVKNKIPLCQTMTLLPSISHPLCRIIAYKEEKHIYYFSLTHSFNSIFSTVVSYSSSLAQSSE